MKSTNLLKKYQPSENDSWVWNYAEIQDIDEMVNLTNDNCSKDAENLFSINLLVGKFNLDMAITRQRHNLASEQILVCRKKDTGALLAWSWIIRGKTFPFSTDEMAEASMAQIDLTLPHRTRLHLLAQILHYWEVWAAACAIPVLISHSIRIDNEGFTNLHRRAGYDIRGGIAIKRIIPL